MARLPIWERRPFPAAKVGFARTNVLSNRSDDIKRIFGWAVIVQTLKHVAMESSITRPGCLEDEVGNEGSPAGLVRSSESFACVSVKVFIKENEFMPVGIGGVFLVLAVGWAVMLVVWEKYFK